MEFAREYAEETYNLYFRNIRGGNAAHNIRRNQQGNNQRGINRVRLAQTILEFVIRGYLVYLFIANLCLSTTQVEVATLEIESLYINYDILDFSTVRLGGNATLQTTIQLNSDFTPTPELAIFNLSIITSDKHDPISTFAYATYKISVYEKQAVVLNFKPYENQLPHKKVMHLQKNLEKGDAWLGLDISFHWQLNKKWFLVFPIHHRRTDLRCDIRFTDLPVDGTHPVICK